MRPEADLLDALRDTPEWMPELSLAAEREQSIVGHVLFSRVRIGTDSTHAVGLGPIAVLPTFQRQGIGRQMIQAGLKAAEALGLDSVVLIGHPSYYPRFGFVPASQFGLQTNYSVPDAVFMARPLRLGGMDDLAGEVRYSSAFGEV